MREAVVAVGLATLISSATVLALQKDSSREIIRRPGVTIASQLLPTDRAVKVYTGPPPLLGFLPEGVPGVEVVSSYASECQAVLVVQVDAQTSWLTPEADWIRTTFTARVLEQLKPAGSSAERFERIQVMQEGGRMTLNGGVAVTAIADWVVPFRVHSRYLVFAQRAGTDTDVVWAYRIGSNRRLESMQSSHYSRERRDSGHGLTLTSAKRAVQAALIKK